MSMQGHYDATRHAIVESLRAHCTQASRPCSWRELSDALNQAGVTRPAGGIWNEMTLAHTCRRWGIGREDLQPELKSFRPLFVGLRGEDRGGGIGHCGANPQRAEVVLQTVYFWEHYLQLSRLSGLSPTYAALADVLNERGLTTARGLAWSTNNLVQYCRNRGINPTDIGYKLKRISNSRLSLYDLRYTPTEPWPTSLVPSLMDQPKPLSHWKVGHIQLHDNVMEEPTAAEQFKMLSPTWLPPRPAQASDANGEGGKPCGSDEEPSLCDGPTTSVQPFRIYE